MGNIIPDAPPSPRFICKSILRFDTGWMVTFPDYEAAGENPFSVRETTRVMSDEDLLEWIPKRIERLTKRRVEAENIVVAPIELPPPAPGKRVRSNTKMKKLYCGHLMPRRAGHYPKRCPPCWDKFRAHISALRRKKRHA